MTRIIVGGEDRTRQFTDWQLKYSHTRKRIELVARFRSGKQFSWPYDECVVEPVETLPGTLLRRQGSPEYKTIQRAEKVGGKFLLVTYPSSNNRYVFPADTTEISQPATYKQDDLFSYFMTTAQARVITTPSEQQLIAQNMEKQLSAIAPVADSALDAYLTRRNTTRRMPPALIFPFGLNQSQMQAVEQAFSHQLSVIEGPPGTGKTQTILNIIANVLLQNKTVAVVSNNNAAVDNVYEKLEKAGLGHVVAKLGSNDNKAAFFADMPPLPLPDDAPAPAPQHIDAAVKQIRAHLEAQSDRARFQAEVEELAIEEKYLMQWMANHDITTDWAVEKYQLSPEKITDLMARLHTLAGDTLRLKDRLTLLFRFGIVDTRPLNSREKRQACFYRLQLEYYRQRLQQTRKKLAQAEANILSQNVPTLIETISQDSLQCLQAHLARQIAAEAPFDAGNYRENISAFLQRFPVIGSTTHSILSSVGTGTQIDYVIIDEASQQDILPGIFSLACAQNIVIVGDRKQLPHVPATLPWPIAAPVAAYDCQQHSILDSVLQVYGDRLPVTLLKEHYRCHPKIIQFCNKQFYDNQLITMTRDRGEKALSLVVTAKGNHNRDNQNLRELESLGALQWDETSQRGFISPFNAQVDLSENHLREDFVSATVHKFQGRECDEIVFSTVLDKKAGEREMGFVDDAQLVNVAISRAKRHFTLVTGDNVFGHNNRHIAALIRYMRYYADNDDIVHSPVVSAFDLLYDEYDASLEKLRARLNPDDSDFRSEQIAARLIRDTLLDAPFSALRLHSQVPLKQLVAHPAGRFTQREQQFMQQGASCDFVLYYRVGKQPAAVIEVDGSQHADERQQERDRLKDAVLSHCGLPLLRLKTIDSRIEEKIADFLLAALQNTPELTAESLLPAE